MATITTFVDGTQAVVDLASRKQANQNELDFSVTNCSSADVVQAVKIPANALVTLVWVLVKTAEGGTATATVGDATDPDGWDASTNLNATAGTVTYNIVGTDAYSGGKFYSTADTIDLVLGNDCDAASVIVGAEYTMVENYA